MTQDPKHAFGGQSGPVDEARVKALLDDLDHAIAGFDERLQAFQAEPQDSTAPADSRGSGFPEIDPNAVRQRTVEPTGKSATSAIGSGSQSSSAMGSENSDLLAELAQAATLQQQSQQSANFSQLEAQKRFDRALRLIFDYLHQLTQHVNVLQPKIPQIYSLDFHHRFEGLRWLAGSVDYRTASQSEQALIESVTLRVQYSTQPLIVTQAAAGADALRKDLQLLNLKVLDESRFEVGQKTAGIRFSIDGVVPLQLNFSSDLKNGLLVLRCRNLCGLGLAAYVITPEAITRRALDGVGRCLIGKAKQMPPEFNAVAFNRYTPEQKAGTP